ncbi:cytochrome P450 family protein [Reticulomyxa filosa]|uniref:Cytochrome P450 family protein n=1 Tax=Reticulomyxa filosa TaxID=46433 RepID=X6P487_RETFI|nr:cytochrome P450 family protein [Reticulomyxa filosa]|eukprot:ETO32933.1 cytochrome P450 family protein [Reticulomyxa filosa]
MSEISPKPKELSRVLSLVPESWLNFLRNSQNSKRVSLIKAVAAFVLFFFLYHSAQRLYRKVRRYPPGPIGLPIIGALGNYYANPAGFLTELGTRYGPVSFFYFGGRPCVSLNTSEICKEVYKKKQYLNRPVFPKDLFQLTILANANGNCWNVRRKLINASLLRLMDRSYVSEVVTDTLEKYTYPKMDECYATKTMWFPREYCAHIAWSTMYYTAFAEKLDLADPIYQKIREMHEVFFKAALHFKKKINKKKKMYPFFFFFERRISVALQGWQ